MNPLILPSFVTGYAASAETKSLPKGRLFVLITPYEKNFANASVRIGNLPEKQISIKTVAERIRM